MEYIKPTEGAYLKHKNGNLLLYGKKDAICTVRAEARIYRNEKSKEHGNYDKHESYIPATPEEITWIKACIAVNKFIPFKNIKIEPSYEIY